MSTALETAIEHMRQYGQALMQADVPALERLLAPDFTYIHKSSRLETRDEIVQAYRTGRRNKLNEYDVTDVRVYPGVSIASGIAHMEVGEDGTIVFDSRFTAVWVDIDGAWKLVSYQSTEKPSA